MTLFLPCSPHLAAQRRLRVIYIWSFLVVLFTCPKDCFARIGDSLKECELRYGAATQLQIPQDLSYNNTVRVYEFNTESYTVLAVIGSHVGTMQISYFKDGKFGQSEAEDIIKRNYSTCEQAVLSNEGITVEDGLTSIRFSLRPYGAVKGDAYLSVGRGTSGLKVWDARKMIDQADSVALTAESVALAPRSRQFAESYQKRLESTASDVIADEWKAINDKVLGATEPSTVLGSRNTSGNMVSVHAPDPRTLRMAELRKKIDARQDELGGFERQKKNLLETIRKEESKPTLSGRPSLTAYRARISLAEVRARIKHAQGMIEADKREINGL